MSKKKGPASPTSPSSSSRTKYFFSRPKEPQEITNNSEESAPQVRLSKNNDNFLSTISKFSLSTDHGDDYAKTIDLISSTESYKNELEIQLTLMRQEIADNPSPEHDDLYELGMLYLKLARIYDIRHVEDEAMAKRIVALELLNDALRKAPSNNFNELSMYFAAKAKCLFHMDRFEEAEFFAKESLTKKPNGLAYETLGYLYKSQGQHEEALNAFAQSLEVDPEYKSAHKIVCLYNQSIVLAALGREDEALKMFDRASKKPYNQKQIDEEDKILIAEMHKPEYKENIKILAEISNSARIRNISESATPAMSSELDKHHESINQVADALSPGTRRQMDDNFALQLKAMNERMAILEREATANKEALEKERKAHLDDKTKLQEALNRMGASEEKIVDEKIIEQHPYLLEYYKKIQGILTDEYAASAVILTGKISDSSRGILGWIGMGVGQVGDAAPPVVKIGVVIAAEGLKAADDAKKMEKNQNYKDIASNQDEMKHLSKELAMRLALQRKDEIDLEADNPTIKTRSEIKAIKKQAADDASKICDFIKSIIFDGRVQGENTHEKVNMIMALIELDQEKQAQSNNDLPEHTIIISSNTLLKIKQKHLEDKIIWKSKPNLEEKFKEYLANSLNFVSPAPINNHEHFSIKLASKLSSDQEVFIIERRTLMIWQHKVKLSETFLCSKEYFHPHVKDVMNQTIESTEEERHSSNDSNQGQNESDIIVRLVHIDASDSKSAEESKMMGDDAHCGDIAI